MPSTYKRKEKTYSNTDLKNAIQEIKDGSSWRKASKKFNNVPMGTIGNHLAGKVTKDHVGRDTALKIEIEIDLANCLTTLSKWGFGLTKEEIKDEVQIYVKQSNLKTPFNNGRPGKDWLKAFMVRHNLSSKKPSLLEKVRQSVASNPFVIYDFYDKIESVTERLNIKMKPNHIWNLDETSLFHDPTRLKVVGAKGQKVSRVTHGSGREATSILACICANSEALPPLVIFTGKNMHSTWKGSAAYPGTTYAVSAKGWMESEIFADWFGNFCRTVPQRPLLLIFDGHSTHLSFSVIKKAQDENVTIIKLPPHSTHMLQPLDKCVFKSLKQKWDKELIRWQRERVGTGLSKASFVDLVGAVWPQSMTKDNIISAFRSTGIFPVDRNKYDVTNFDPIQLQSYNLQHQFPQEPQVAIESQNEETITQNLENQNAQQPDNLKMQQPLMTPSSVNIPSTSKDTPLSFAATLAHIFHTPATQTTNAPPPKRRRIDMFSRVITDEQLGKVITKMEENKKQRVPIVKKTLNTQVLNNSESDSSGEEEYEEKDKDKVAKIKRALINAQKNIIVGEYYTAYYEKSFYIGRIEEEPHPGKYKMKFLYKTLKGYDWPMRSDEEVVAKEFIFYGPIPMRGTIPFSINDNCITKLFSELKKFGGPIEIML